MLLQRCCARCGTTLVINTWNSRISRHRLAPIMTDSWLRSVDRNVQQSTMFFTLAQYSLFFQNFKPAIWSYLQVTSYGNLLLLLARQCAERLIVMLVCCAGTPSGRRRRWQLLWRVRRYISTGSDSHQRHRVTAAVNHRCHRAGSAGTQSGGVSGVTGHCHSTPASLCQFTRTTQRSPWPATSHLGHQRPSHGQFRCGGRPPRRTSAQPGRQRCCGCTERAADGHCGGGNASTRVIKDQAVQLASDSGIADGVQRGNVADWSDSLCWSDHSAPSTRPGCLLSAHLHQHCTSLCSCRHLSSLHHCTLSASHVETNSRPIYHSTLVYRSIFLWVIYVVFNVLCVCQVQLLCTLCCNLCLLYLMR